MLLYGEYYEDSYWISAYSAFMIVLCSCFFLLKAKG